MTLVHSSDIDMIPFVHKCLIHHTHMLPFGENMQTVPTQGSVAVKHYSQCEWYEYLVFKTSYPQSNRSML